jgi:hypothetical protein
MMLPLLATTYGIPTGATNAFGGATAVKTP